MTDDPAESPLCRGDGLGGAVDLAISHLREAASSFRQLEKLLAGDSL